MNCFQHLLLVNRFQSTLSVWRATICWCVTSPPVLNFNPRSPCGERPSSIRLCHQTWYFNPRSPCGERPCCVFSITVISTISIHALRVESDSGLLASKTGKNISIHALRVESDACDIMQFLFIVISIHALRVESDQTVGQQQKRIDISIHALRVESDDIEPAPTHFDEVFQSTLSVWRATQHLHGSRARQGISIHALRVESDRLTAPAAGVALYFNPRSPCGERRTTPSYGATAHRFQSTLSVWRATKRTRRRNGVLAISIHALRVESDSSDSKGKSLPPYFNPRSPCGEPLREKFQSTLSVWRATAKFVTGQTILIDFNPRSPCGERRFVLRFRQV